MTIRAATAGDVGSIRDLEQKSAAAAHWSAEQYEVLLEQGVLLVAEEGQEICGFVGARAVAGDWEIENMAVALGFLRRGIGSRLLRELTARARQAEARAMLLEVRESNLAARRLYEAGGFREAGRRRGYYASPAEDAILYSLSIE